MDQEKPHCGKITNWGVLPLTQGQKDILEAHTGQRGCGLGFVIYGEFERFGWRESRTSYVVAADSKTGEIETRNSRYTLVSPVE